MVLVIQSVDSTFRQTPEGKTLTVECKLTPQFACVREPKPKRKRGGGIDHAASDDSDFDDMHKIAGATAALRLGGESQAGSAAAQSGRDFGARSFTAKTAAGKSTAGRSTPSPHSVSGEICQPL